MSCFATNWPCSRTQLDVIRAAAFLLLVTALFLAVSSANAQHSTKENFVVGFPEDNMSNDWRAAQARELAVEFERYGNVEFHLADAQGSPSQNIHDIEGMVSKGAELLFLGPRNAKLLTPVVERLRRKGIHIVLLTRRIESHDFDTFISPNDFNIAKSAAELLAAHLNNKGRILMLEGVPTTTTAIQRGNGFKAGLSAFPEVRLVATKTGNYSRADGLRAMEEALKEGIKFDAIYSHNDAMLVGARIAMKGAGIDPREFPSVGIDYISEARDAIRTGEQLASFTYPTCGKEGADAAMKILKGEFVPKFIDVPAALVTKENVEETPTIF